MFRVFLATIVIIFTIVALIKEYNGFYLRDNQVKKALKSKNNIKDINAIYQYINESGNLVITNKPNIKAQKIELPPLIMYAVPMSANDLSAKGYTSYNATTGLINKFSNNYEVYKNSGVLKDGRMIVLLEELEHEKKALIDSIYILNDAKKNKLITENEAQYNNRLNTLNDDIKEHRKNISLLNSAISSVN